MRGFAAVFKRELSGYFITPVAYVFIVVFLVLVGVFTFNEDFGGFYGPSGQGQADLTPFFAYHPWLYLFLIPAISMRLWAEEHRSGTIELLATLPIPTWAIVVGKYAAAWVFAGIALALTFPMWMTVNFLGDPDNGVIAAGYLGSFVLAGAFMAIGACISAATKSQVIAFVLSVVVCLGFLLAGFSPVLSFIESWAPQAIVETVSGFSFLTHFQAISRGVIDLRDVVFFVSLIGLALLVNAIVLELKRGS
ncbi:MAG: ABC transporter permease [Planctomycetota bacterium]|nr:MAG: ABC transporter permease [Planctomycetota bacterium]